MSEDSVLSLVTCLELAVTGALLAIIPFVTRKGLLFGVHVGEASAGAEARRLQRAWLVVTVLLTGFSLVLALALSELGRPALGLLLSVGVLLVGILGLYLGLHRRARALAAPGAAPGEDEHAPMPPGALLTPSLALLACVLLGLAALAHALLHYPDMPARVPVHFDAAGRPDAFGERSLAGLLILPLCSLLIGPFLAVFALLTVRATPAPRAGSRVSREAQHAFRTSVARLLAGLALLTSALMTLLSVGSVRTALGRAEGLGPLPLVLGVGVGLLALGGVAWIAFRHGQGGAHAERDEPGEIVDGLADERHWKLGLFYVNRDDPAWLIEKRFGIGYTINFGNGWAVALLGALLLSVALILGLSVAAAT